MACVYKFPKCVRRALTNTDRLVIYLRAWVWGGNLSLCYNLFSTWIHRVEDCRFCQTPEWGGNFRTALKTNIHKSLRQINRLVIIRGNWDREHLEYRQTRIDRRLMIKQQITQNNVERRLTTVLVWDVK